MEKFHFKVYGKLQQCLYQDFDIGILDVNKIASLASSRLEALELLEKSELQGSHGNSDKDRDDDLDSHFVLLLAHCSHSDYQKQIYIGKEVALLKKRLNERTSLLTQAKEILIQVPKLSAINSPPKEVLTYFKPPSSSGKSTPKIYKSSELSLIHLIGRRGDPKVDCVILGGDIYIPESFLINMILDHYKEELEARLKMLSEIWESFPQHIRSVFATLIDSAPTVDFSTSTMPTADTIHTMVDPSFPLCMSYLYDQLQSHSHLKHDGRLQLGLFLKAVGFTLDSALKFWKKSFSKAVSGTKFDKEYAYNINHMYGKVGAMRSYPARTCSSIQRSQVADGQFHGCPFKHNFMKDPEQFKRLVDHRLSKSIPTSDERKKYIEEIITLCTDGHPNVACKRVFELTHGNTHLAKAITHPNEYFRDSRNIIDGNTVPSTSADTEAPSSASGIATQN